MWSSRRNFIKKLMAGLTGVIIGCEKNPVSSSKAVIIKSVAFSTGTAEDVEPGGEQATITFSGSVSNVTTETVYVETLGGEKLTGHLVVKITAEQYKITLPLLTPGSKYRLVVDGVTAADGSLVDGDKNGSSGGKYKLDLTVLPPTSFVHIYNLNENSIENVVININVSNKLNKDTVTTTSVLLLEKTTQAQVPIQVNFDQSKKEIQLVIPQMEYGVDYIIRITESVKDIWGFSLDGDNDNIPGGVFEYEFRTAANPDTQPPQVTQVSPIAGSVGVDINNSVFAIFNEALKNENMSEKIFVTAANGSHVQGGVSYDVNVNTLRFIPENPFNHSEIYTVHLAGIEDLAGNDFNNGQEYTWSFTTEINPALHTPEAVSNLGVATGANPGEVELSWQIPADKATNGVTESGVDLLFDIYRSVLPIVNEGNLELADLAVNGYAPGLTTGSMIKYMITNPENAQTYYFAIKVRDKDGNVSQFTASSAVTSKGFGLKLQLVDALLYGRDDVAAASQVWAGIKIFQDERQIGMSDNNGIAQFEAAYQSGALNIGDVKSSVIETYLPYNLTGSAMTQELLTPLFEVDSFPVKEAIKVLNPLVTDISNPANFAYIMKWADSVTIYNVAEDLRVIPLYIHGMLEEKTEETRQLLLNLNQWLELATKGKYRLQTLDEATVLNREIITEEDETGFEDSFLNGNEPQNKGILWTHSNPEFNRPARSETNGAAYTPAGPHGVTRGLVITQNTLDPSRVFTEFWRAIMNMPGQLEGSDWDMTAINDEYDTSQFVTKAVYRGISNLLYVEEIFASVLALPVSSKIMPNVINFPAQGLSLR
ncbi:MAG TPA: Ig-like domain-containing protein [bacterium]|nr:Ig-like domain-containing protein [bacterium]HPN44679.1 Ig-like domain-containing protein [bacterium]